MPFPAKTTSTVSTATFSLKIQVDGNFVSDGTVAAYIGDDIRSGAVSGDTGPTGDFIFSVSGGLTETELTAQTFTFKYRNTSDEVFICSPTIEAGPGDNIGNAVAPTVLTATQESTGTPFPAKTTSTVSTATFSLKIQVDGNFVSDGTVAAYIGDDIRSGAVSGDTGPTGDFIFSVSGGLTETELTAQTFTFKYKNTSNQTYICSPTIEAGPGDNIGNAVAPTVLTATLESGGGGGGTPVTNPTADGDFAAVTVTQGQTVQSIENLEAIFSDVTTFSYTTAASEKVTVTTSGSTLTGKFTISAAADAAPGQYTLTVTGVHTDGNTPATATISVTVVLANLVPTISTPFPNLSFGKSTSVGSYVIENVLSHFTDADNAPNPLSISSVSVTSGTNVSVSNDNSADTITIDYAANPDLGSATIKVTATDGADSVDATFTSTISVTRGIYLWTYQDTANNYTTIKMKITTEVIKVPGIHLKYSATSGLSFPDQETTSPVGGGSASAYSSSGWQQNHVNSDTATPYIVLFGDASKALGSGDYDLAFFESLFTISDIVGISDQHGNLVNANNYALSEPPIIFEDTTRDPTTDILYGDVNVNETLNTHDLTMLAKYLVGNDEEYTGESGLVKAVTYVNAKIAENSGTYAWIDVNKNGEIDVGDACRLAEKLADPDYNIIGERDKF